MSSSYATPILYLNMGGEMLYMLQHWSEVKRISPNISTQVFNEVIFAFLKPKQLQMIFQPGPLMSLSSLRAIIVRVVLSSIVKISTSGEGNLFDIMITMVKYQLATATGPREVILSTLNHIDAMRNMTVNRMLIKYIDLVHRLILNTYGKMTYKEVWQIGVDCMLALYHHNMRILDLVHLKMQNVDGSFIRLTQKYNEKYLERREVLENFKLMDYEDEEAMGSFSSFGDRVTLLGRNMYTYFYEYINSISSSENLEQVVAVSNDHMHQEL